MNRRSFLRGAAGAGLALGASLPSIGAPRPVLADKPNLSDHSGLVVEVAI